MDPLITYGPEHEAFSQFYQLFGQLRTGYSDHIASLPQHTLAPIEHIIGVGMRVDETGNLGPRDIYTMQSTVVTSVLNNFPLSDHFGFIPVDLARGHDIFSREVQQQLPPGGMMVVATVPDYQKGVEEIVKRDPSRRGLTAETLQTEIEAQIPPGCQDMLISPLHGPTAWPDAVTALQAAAVITFGDARYIDAQAFQPLEPKYLHVNRAPVPQLQPYPDWPFYMDVIFRRDIAEPLGLEKWRPEPG